MDTYCYLILSSLLHMLYGNNVAHHTLIMLLNLFLRNLPNILCNYFHDEISLDHIMSCLDLPKSLVLMLDPLHLMPIYLIQLFP
jgi:hypothetical protein